MLYLCNVIQNKGKQQIGSALAVRRRDTRSV